jgi:hypothetical protein
VDGFDLEIRAVMSDAMHLVRPREHALCAVAQHRPVFPAALPQLVHDLHVFFGNFVARVVIWLSRKPNALGGAAEISGDDVPADTAAGQMIKRRKPARQHVRMFVRDRARNTEA